MEFSANSCLEICKSSVELVIKIQEFKDLEPKGSGPSSLWKLSDCRTEDSQPRRAQSKSGAGRLPGNVIIQETQPAEQGLAGCGALVRVCRNERWQQGIDQKAQALRSGRWWLEF